MMLTSSSQASTLINSSGAREAKVHPFFQVETTKDNIHKWYLHFATLTRFFFSGPRHEKFRSQACFLHWFLFAFRWELPEVFDANVGTTQGEIYLEENDFDQMLCQIWDTRWSTWSYLIKHGHKCSEPTSSNEMEGKVFMLDECKGHCLSDRQGYAFMDKPWLFVQTFEDFWYYLHIFLFVSIFPLENTYIYENESTHTHIYIYIYWCARHGQVRLFSTGVPQPRLDSIIENTPNDLLIEIILVSWSISFAARSCHEIAMEASTNVCHFGVGATSKRGLGFLIDCQFTLTVS